MKNLIVAALFVASTTLQGSAALAQDKRDLTPDQQGEAQFELQIARNLISYGETKGDALALVTAAKMIVGVPGRVVADKTAGADAPTFDIEAVLKKAEALAPGDALIAKVAGDVRTAAEATARPVWLCQWEWRCSYYGCGWVYMCY